MRLYGRHEPLVAAPPRDAHAYTGVRLWSDIAAWRYLGPPKRIYDRTGRLLRGVVVTHFLAERVRLEPASEPGLATNRLRDTLVNFLHRVGTRIEKPLDRCSLDDLLSAMDRFKTE